MWVFSILNCSRWSQLILIDLIYLRVNFQFCQGILNETGYHLNQDFTISLLEDDLDDKSGIFLKVGKNIITWNNASIAFEIRKIESIFNGLCHVILPLNLSSPGIRYPFFFQTNVQHLHCSSLHSASHGGRRPEIKMFDTLCLYLYTTTATS